MYNNQHCVRLEFGDFWESSPKFFFRECGGLTFGVRRPPKVGNRAPRPRGLRKYLKIYASSYVTSSANAFLGMEVEDISCKSLSSIGGIISTKKVVK